MVARSNINGKEVIYDENKKEWVGNNDFNNTENERYILTEQFITLSDVSFVKDNSADVDTYYTVGAVVDLLNEQHETIQRQSMIIQRQEMALSNMNNSRYKCAFCGAVGFLTETFQRLIE